MSQQSLNKAIKNHALWHSRESDGVVRRSSAALDATRFCAVGVAVNIVYESDKWYGKNEKKYFYDHDFDSRPKVYSPCKCRDGGCRSITRSSLLGVSDNSVPVTELGTVDTFTMDVDGETEHLEFKGKTYLYSTPDLKALVIPSGKDVLVVRGSKMRVTSRGIVN